jgi:hypothetical protein
MVLIVETSQLFFWQAMHVGIFAGIASTALRWQGHSVARAAGPRHRRPRLRHRIHRRGHASAASRPRNAHARVVTKVYLSAQRSADRSVQRRSHGHCAAGLPPPCAGLPGDVLAVHRLGNALDQALRLAAPHRSPRGTAVSTDSAARCPCYDFLSPPVPLVRRLRPSLRSWRSAAVPLLPAPEGGADGVCLSTGFSPSLHGCALSCPRAPASRRDPRGGGATPGTGAHRGPRRVGHGSQDVDAPADGVRCAPWTAQQVPWWQVLV